MSLTWRPSTYPFPFRELSNGHFSEDNQKRLNGINTEIPIYEAKMTRDSRLVVGRAYIARDGDVDILFSIKWIAFLSMTQMYVAGSDQAPFVANPSIWLGWTTRHRTVFFPTRRSLDLFTFKLSRFLEFILTPSLTSGFGIQWGTNLEERVNSTVTDVHSAIDPIMPETMSSCLHTFLLLKRRKRTFVLFPNYQKKIWKRCGSTWTSHYSY